MPEHIAGSMGSAGVANAIAQANALLDQLEDLEPRLSTSGAGEVELTLLERATELVEKAGRLLERLGHGSG